MSGQKHELAERLVQFLEQNGEGDTHTSANVNAPLACDFTEDDDDLDENVDDEESDDESNDENDNNEDESDGDDDQQ